MITKRSDAIDGFVMASPWLVGFAAFILWPILQSLIYSFQSYDVVNPAKWIGAANYVQLIHDERFWKSLYNTLYYVIFSVPLQIGLGLLLAFLVTRNIPGKTLFKSIFYLPSVISGIAVALIWKLMFQGSFGVINSLLFYIHIDGPTWLDSVRWSKPALIIMSLWNVGTIMIIYIAAIQNISPDFYEAAEVEGAGSLRMFFSITLPMISPVIFFTLIIRLIDAFKIFDQVYALTADPPTLPPGGPAESTLMLVVFLYQTAFASLDMGYASALAWVLLLIVLGLTLANFSLAPKWVSDD